MKKKQRGGARIGAGRKRKGEEARIPLSARVKPETLEALRDMDCSVGEGIDAVVEYYFNTPF